MKVLVALGLLVLAITADQNTHIKTVTSDGSTKCQRQIQKNVSPGEIRITSVRKCNKDNANSASALLFDINTNGRPDIKIGYYRKMKDADAKVQAFSSFRIFFERVIEYVEVNNVTGYQPGRNPTDDHPGTIEFLINKKWNPVQESVTQGTGTSEIHEFFATSVDGEVTFAYHFTTDFVETTNNTRMVPNSGKFSFSVNNHVYVDPNAAGLAFRIFVISRGGIRSKSRTDTDTGLDLTNQGAVAVNDNGLERNFFTWNQFVTSLKGDFTLYNKTMDVDFDRSEADGDLKFGDGAVHVSTIWFSVPRAPGDTATSLLWDPYFGVTEDNASASSLLLSLFVSLFAMLFVM